MLNLSPDIEGIIFKTEDDPGPIRIGEDMSNPDPIVYFDLSQRLIGFSLRYSNRVDDNRNGDSIVELGVLTDTTNCEELVWTFRNPFTNMNTAIDGTVVT